MKNNGNSVLHPRSNLRSHRVQQPKKLIIYRDILRDIRKREQASHTQEVHLHKVPESGHGVQVDLLLPTRQALSGVRRERQA